MKVRLLNDGGYHGLSQVRFPVEVEAEYNDGKYYVYMDELDRIGGISMLYRNLTYIVFLENEVEEL